ncbi:N-acetyltransferase family protein [Paenibacillus sp.]|uniref:GNAT family N-acetyltransferase n=1 Tax=Paenibacillus sp. TaxID=58172 RepID=UPI00281268AE|nr:N-acetyltransferase family protein [Paenibacillus sp.]
MIRQADARDIPAILDIYNDAILHTTAVYDYEPHPLERRKQWYDAKVEEGYPVLVYESDGRVAGFASFGPFRAWAAYRYTIEHSIYVHRDFRKQGIGQALLERLIDIANEREYAVMVGGIDASNENSIRLHEKLGFRHSGTIAKAGYKFGRWLDLAFYQRELNGPKQP